MKQPWTSLEDECRETKFIEGKTLGLRNRLYNAFYPTQERAKANGPLNNVETRVLQVWQAANLAGGYSDSSERRMKKKVKLRDSRRVAAEATGIPCANIRERAIASEFCLRD